MNLRSPDAAGVNSGGGTEDKPIAPVEANALHPCVTLSGLSKTYGVPGRREIVALSNIDLGIQPGQFVCVVGPSGCGKSTLLKILAGLESQSDGSVDFAFPASERPLRSMVFQEQGVFPWMTVLNNAAYGLTVRGIPKKERQEIARGYLETLDLGRFADAYPRSLSGGMKQRVNIARAFANDPELLLMDEPMANLDEYTKLIVQDDLLRLWEEHRKTVVFVTHSLDEAIVLGDRILVMSSRPGRIVEDIPIDLARPRRVFELQSDESFLRLRGHLWEFLKSEIDALRIREALPQSSKP
ncbi:MAG: ABC transporter ATP-binding protein [Hydrogenophaga sp.]|jgi:NitT/TauT family transport system ATP-binding protein|nr:ABC transporter ATP-binding protein [Hydrogenophaga sp.]